MTKGEMPDHVEARIRSILGLPPGAPFPLCPAKDREKIKILRLKGDDTHRQVGHICPECACGRIAGSGTTGDFYGIGIDTGHFGVGYCAKHDKTKKDAMDKAVTQMRAIQSVGSKDRFIQEAEYEARVATNCSEVRQGIDLVKSVLKDFYDKIGVEGSLTESAKGGPQPASDVTRMKLACEIASTLSKLSKDEFTVKADDYIHIDELRMRIPRMIAMTFRFVLDEEQQGKWLDEFKSIWRDVRTGQKA
jgi:hypothetical protein